MTLRGEKCFSNVGQIDLRVDGGKAESLVVQEDPLGFDVLIDVNAIKALGGVSISKSGEAHFFRKQASAFAKAVLSIEQPDFHAGFDQRRNEWTGSWKWTDAKAPCKLRNCIAGYAMSTKVR